MHDALIEAMSTPLNDVGHVRGCSWWEDLGKGAADAYSDIVLLAIVEEDRKAAFPSKEFDVSGQGNAPLRARVGA